jgi:cell cycle checkpoint protein
MWVDQHAPTKSAELCVAPKKVKEVRAWLEDALQLHSNKKLLILVGSPGIGKSTMIKVLAKELGLVICSWNESVAPRDNNAGAGAGGSNILLSIDQTSPLDSFQEFLQQTGAGFSSLTLSSSDHPKQRQFAFAKSTSTRTSNNSANNNNNNNKSLILLEDWPNLHGPDMELRFRTLMANHLQQRSHGVPTVLIFSDVSEGKHRPDDLERLVAPAQLYSYTNSSSTSSAITSASEISSASGVQIMTIHKVTKPKMKKVLQAIATSHGCDGEVPLNFWEQVHDQSSGDLRHAILSLQLELSGRTCLPKANNNMKHKERDTKLSTFHALGKLLYAKRNITPESNTLAFDPEGTMERSDMGLGGSLGFLEYHSVDFFTDIIELSSAMQHFSDAALLLDCPMDFVSSSSLLGVWFRISIWRNAFIPHI